MSEDLNLWKVEIYRERDGESGWGRVKVRSFMEWKEEEIAKETREDLQRGAVGKLLAESATAKTPCRFGREGKRRTMGRVKCIYSAWSHQCRMCMGKYCQK